MVRFRRFAPRRTNLTEKNFAGFTAGGLKYIMPKNHVSKYITHPDLTFNLDKFGTTDNVIFITGLYGAGKTYTAERLAQQHHALHLRQDWLCWSEQYDSPESKFFVKLFQELHPETRAYFAKQQWRTHVDHATMQKYRQAYDQMILDHIAANPQQLFIYEGSELFARMNNLHFLQGRPLIIKRTSVHQSFLNLKQRDKGSIGRPESRRLWQQYRPYYLKHQKIINQFITTLTAKH